MAAAVLAVALATAFAPPVRSLAGRGASVAMSVAPVEPTRVVVSADADAVAAALCARLEAAAAAAIAERGHFALAIPGGSILKMLEGTSPAWAAQTTLAYVNHKAVAMSDEQLATHAKARKLFLDGWRGVRALVMGGSADAAAEAKAYEAQLRALPPHVLPRAPDGLPIFDLMLIGVGDDGHVGSLYPGRPEVGAAGAEWVLPVEMKVPGSITLSLPVMAHAKEVLIAACGVSDKYPQGKSDAMRRAIEAGDESAGTFPAVGLRGCAVWLVDEAAASKLSDRSSRSYGGYHYPSSSTSSSSPGRYSYPTASSGGAHASQQPPAYTATTSGSSHTANPPPYTAAMSGTAYGANPPHYSTTTSTTTTTTHPPGYNPTMSAPNAYHAPSGGSSSMSPGTAAAAGALAGAAVGYVAGSSSSSSAYGAAGGYVHGAPGSVAYGGAAGSSYGSSNASYHAHHSGGGLLATLVSVALALALTACACALIYRVTQPSRKPPSPTLPQYALGVEAGAAAAFAPPYAAAAAAPPPAPPVDGAHAARVAELTGVGPQTAAQLVRMRHGLQHGAFVLVDDSAQGARPLSPGCVEHSAAGARGPPTVWGDMLATCHELASMVLAVGPPALQPGAAPQPVVWLKFLNDAEPCAIDEHGALRNLLADRQPCGAADLRPSLAPLLAQHEGAPAVPGGRLVVLLLGDLPAEPQLPELAELLRSKAAWVRVSLVVCGDDAQGGAAQLAAALGGLPGVSVCGAYTLARSAAASHGVPLGLAEHVAHALLPSGKAAGYGAAA
ncbi:hypothetical protein KFE25_004748 [Diacronema lutheri]|uniref:Glucosamine/galactosamine-6-phosphate isomerase domain-containing protein n=1 Tax=Diacronema lutheri TaxID=2081491 RepID=A0A8J6C5M9_DIALT|nr:hypothetical protein KFE25_004748 [Diacronema lutheri]